MHVPSQSCEERASSFAMHSKCLCFVWFMQQLVKIETFFEKTAETKSCLLYLPSVFSEKEQDKNVQ